MASDKIINVRVDVTKLKREHFYVGEKGTYADLVIFFNETQDQYGNNGMIKQSVNKETYEKEKALAQDKKTDMPILGNCREYKKGGASKEGSPGYFGGDATATNATPATDVTDKLPF